MTYQYDNNAFGCSDDDWENTKPAEGGGRVPDGTYEAVLSKIALKQSKAGENYLNATFTILSDDYRGRLAFKPWFFSEKGRPHAKADFLAMDIVIARMSDLQTEETLLEFVGQVCEIKISTRKNNKGEENQNVWIEKKLRK